MEFYVPDKRENDRRFKKSRGSYNVKTLWEHHHEIVRRVALGQRNKDIARSLGITQLTVSNTRNSEVGQAKIDAMVKAMDNEAIDIGRRIQDFAPKALQVLEDIIEGNYEEASLSLRAKFASQHLARAGFGEVKKVATVQRTLTKDDVERIKERALRGAKEVGIIDAEFECIDEALNTANGK